eukprot:TRINITY_DN5854_c0_g1_i2.p1 TRINITY_DN5854_c0_g1~~TRINITY_DN5854_c0_g1_i2.p1  ORF type:complete len:1237 (+),score=389.23 TRINITY_DN5854_c0_g1_i2:534-3713(+)
MHGRFPSLAGSVLADLRSAIHGCSGFKVKEVVPGVVSLDYRSASGYHPTDVFPEPVGPPQQRWLMAARRECRGLLCCESSGRVLARRFHKFFNLGEVPETEVGDRGLPERCEFYEKLDGSLVSPFLLPSTSRVTWATRAAPAPVESLVSAEGAERVRGWLFAGLTPLFEWLEEGRTAHVVQQQRSSLVMLALRRVDTGEYLPRIDWEQHATGAGIAVAPSVPIRAGTVSEAAAAASALDGKEGVVLTSPDGWMMKLKSVWYLSLVGGKGLVDVLRARPSLDGVPAPVVWRAILSEVADDVLPAARRMLSEADGDRLAAFAAAERDAEAALDSRLAAWGDQVRADGSSDKQRLQRAVAHACDAGWRQAVSTAYARGGCSDAARREHLRRQLLSLAEAGRVDALSALGLPDWDGAGDATPLRIKEVFCDLDGVLADFNAGLLRDTGREAGDYKTLELMWRAVSQAEQFFARLPWMSGGRALWSELVRHRAATGCRLAILTATPKGNLAKRSAEQKRQWCAENLRWPHSAAAAFAMLRRGVDPPAVAAILEYPAEPAPEEVITCLSHMKAAHAKPGALLIDDSEEHRGPWEARGGTFLLWDSGDCDTLLRDLRRTFALAEADWSPSCPCQIEAVQVLLDQPSKDRLAAAVPVRHPVCHSDHVTLQWHPQVPSLAGLEVGCVVRFSADGVVRTDEVDVVRVAGLEVPGMRCAEPLHVTISTARGVSPKSAGDALLAHPPSAIDIALSGRVAVVVVAAPPSSDPPLNLPEWVRERAARLHECGKEGSLRFKAEDLSADERAALRKWATAVGMTHSLDGAKGLKRLTLSMPRGGPQPQAAGPRWKKTVTDRGDFGRLLRDPQLRAAGAEAPRAEPAGRVGDGGVVHWGSPPDTPEVGILKQAFSGSEYSGPNAVVVLRGLPGSGKSTLAARLACAGAVTCSADAFFDGAGAKGRKAARRGYGGGFDPRYLAEAHAHARESFASALRSAAPLVAVDNTGSRRREYDGYVEAAAEAGYVAVVVEVAGPDGVSASARSVHSVPRATVEEMQRRWEADDRAVLLLRWDG